MGWSISASILLIFCFKQAESFIRGNATCDNIMSFYADGVLYDNSTDWKVSSVINIPDNTSVVAIECEDLGTAAGIKAALDNGIKTDVSWKCSNRFEAGWNQIGFNDSAWSFAVIQDEKPWGSHAASLVGNADWIWTSEYTGQHAVVYCRKVINSDTPATTSSETDAASSGVDTHHTTNTVDTTTAIDKTTTVDKTTASTTSDTDTSPTTTTVDTTISVETPRPTTSDTDTPLTTTTVDTTISVQTPGLTTSDTDTPPTTTAETTISVETPRPITSESNTPPTTTVDTTISVETPRPTTSDTDTPPTTTVDTTLSVESPRPTTSESDTPPPTSSGAGTQLHTPNKTSTKELKKLCFCNCDKRPNNNQTNNLQAKITSLQKDLKVTAKNLSSTIRRRKSAADSRVSSSIIGTISVIILICTIGIMIVADIPTIAKHIYSSFCDVRKSNRETKIM